MFPFQQSGEQPYELATEPTGEQDQNLIAVSSAAEAGLGSMNLNLTNHTPNYRGRGRGRRSLLATNSIANYSEAGTSSNINIDDHENKKLIHRNIERQRRQEMSTLYASLRSVLPADYIKGRRATSDQIEGTVNYIKDLEREVRELGDKRDELKRYHEISMSMTDTTMNVEVGGSSSSCSRSTPGSVVILPRLGGLDIEISVGYDDEGFRLSSALQIVLDEGLSVASCTSTKVEELMIHNIQSEVSDISSIDIHQLHQRLIDLVC